MRREDRGETLAAATRFVRPQAADGPTAQDLTFMAQLIGSGVVTRAAFDDAATSVLASAGADAEGVREWLSWISDAELAEAFGSPSPKMPTAQQMAVLAGVDHEVPAPEDAVKLAASLVGLSDADRPALFGARDLRAVELVKRETPGTTVVCESCAERAAVAVWLSMKGVAFDAGNLVMLDDAGGFDRLACVEPVDDVCGLADRLLGPGGVAAFTVLRPSLSGRGGEPLRLSVVKSGMLDASVDAEATTKFEAFRRFGCWLLVKGRDLGRPVYLAKAWGKGMEDAIPGRPGSEAWLEAVAEAVRGHRDIPYFGQDVEVGAILSQAMASLRLDDYAQTVPPSTARFSDFDISEVLGWYREHAGDEAEDRRRFAEACERAARSIGIDLG